MIRVFHLSKALGRGGAEVLLKEGLAVADRQRFEYSYGYLQSRPDHIANDLRAQGARVDCFHLNGNLQMVLRAQRVAGYLREKNIDVVHAHLPMAGVVARVAGRIAGVPVIYTEHGPPERYHWIVRGLNRLTWSWQETVVAISDEIADSIRETMGGEVPVRTVQNGVNAMRFLASGFERSEVRDRLGIPSDVPVVGTVAGFRDTAQKRLDLWLQVAREIHGLEPHTRFLLVGEGPLRTDLERLAKSLGIEPAVHFAGYQADVRPFLRAMDVFLVSSAYEGLPIAPLEAMAMGVAVVGTDVKGVRRLVKPEETGLLASFDEAVTTTLADMALSLIRNPGFRRRLAAAGRETVIDNFSIERMQAQLESVYTEVLAKG